MGARRTAHLIELFALDFPYKLHHNGLCECAIHQSQGIILIPEWQCQPSMLLRA